MKYELKTPEKIHPRLVALDDHFYVAGGFVATQAWAAVASCEPNDFRGSAFETLPRAGIIKVLDTSGYEPALAECCKSPAFIKIGPAWVNAGIYAAFGFAYAYKSAASWQAKGASDQVIMLVGGKIAGCIKPLRPSALATYDGGALA